MEFAAVDVDEWRALAEDLDTVLLALHAREILKHGLGGAHLAEQGVFYLGLQALGGQFESGALALDDDLAQYGGIGFQSDGAQVAACCFQHLRFVAQIGNFDDGPCGMACEGKPAIGPGRRSGDKGAVIGA